MREKVPTWRLNCRCPSARRRWRWAVRLRNGFSVGTGATRAACAAQNRARRFSCPTMLAEKTAALGFPPPAGVAPLSNEVGTIPRTTHRNTGGSCASRGLRLFSRQRGLNEDAAGTIRAGRENRSPVHWGARSDDDSRSCGRRARRGRCLGRGKNSAGSGDSLEIVHLFSKRIGDAWREASRRIAVGESRRSIGGRIVRE